MASFEIEIDVIIPVYNAEETLEETIASAMTQKWKDCGTSVILDDNEDSNTTIVMPHMVTVHVCCYDDGSTDQSWKILQHAQKSQYNKSEKSLAKSSESPQPTTLTTPNEYAQWKPVSTHLCILRSEKQVSRGAGYARNRAAAMRKNSSSLNNSAGAIRFICWLDSDDVMYPTRIYEQCRAMLQMRPKQRCRTLIGCLFDRIPEDATWHYTNWCNNLSQERLWLERFRELTVIQPTWFMTRFRYDTILGGYLEAPPQSELLQENEKQKNQKHHDNAIVDWVQEQQRKEKEKITSTCSTANSFGEDVSWRLYHESETNVTLRVAEDLRMFHEHLNSGGIVRRIDKKLVGYRHRGQSQCSQTPRKLLQQLRVRAFEYTILQNRTNGTAVTTGFNGPFIVWGSGRDAKEFVKSLSPVNRKRVYCMLDVDDKKIAIGFYHYYTKIQQQSKRRQKKKPKQERKTAVQSKADLPSSPSQSGDTNCNAIYKKQESDQSNEETISNETDDDVSFNIPIVHFSAACADELTRTTLHQSWSVGNNKDDDQRSNCRESFGRIVKGNSTNFNNRNKDDTESISKVSCGSLSNIVPKKRQKTNPFKLQQQPAPIPIKREPGAKAIDYSIMSTLPVVVCVAMYRTNGALEHNVKQIGRSEGQTLWHFN